MKENKMTKKPQIDTAHVVHNLETLKVLSDPFRMEILRLISDANMNGNFSTVKEISEALDLPPTKLYYHINLLEKHGLILIGDTQIVSGIIEKQYQVVAENITVDKDILATSEGPEDEKLEALLESIQSLLDGIYQDVKKSMQFSYMQKKTEKEDGAEARERTSMQLFKNEINLTIEQAEMLKQEIEDLIKKVDELSKANVEDQTETIPFGFSILLAPYYHKKPPKNN
jgi:DNA-binding transcriptional ArsR family regulator